MADYVEFALQTDRLHATMYRVVNPEAATLSVEAKDSFEVLKK